MDDSWQWLSEPTKWQSQAPMKSHTTLWGGVDDEELGDLYLHPLSNSPGKQEGTSYINHIIQTERNRNTAL